MEKEKGSTIFCIDPQQIAYLLGSTTFCVDPQEIGYLLWGPTKYLVGRNDKNTGLNSL